MAKDRMLQAGWEDKERDTPLHIIPRGLGKKLGFLHHSFDRGVERI